MSHSIDIDRNLSSVYYLLNQEYSSILLNQYFSGDSLTYSISPKGNQVELNNANNSTYALDSSQPVLAMPNKNIVIQSTCIYYEQFCKIAFYGAGNNLTVFSYNFTSGFESILYQIMFDDPVVFTSMALNLKGFSILVITVREPHSNHFYNVSFGFESNGTLILNQKYKIGVSKLLNELNITDISQDHLSGKLMVAGINSTFGYLIQVEFGVEVVEKYHLTFKRNIILSKILVLINENTTYVLLVEENLLLSVIEIENSYLSINNSIYIPSIEFIAFSMEFTDYFNDYYIIIGTVSKGIIVSSDFDRIFIKNLTLSDSEIYPAPTLGLFFFFLVRGPRHNEIVIVNSDLDIILNFELKGIHRQATAWLGVNFFNQEFILMYLQEKVLKSFSIFYTPAQLNFTSALFEINYTLSITDSFKNKLTQNFSVVPIIEEDFLISTDNFLPQIFSFDNMKATVEFSIYDYIYGSSINNGFLDIDDDEFKKNFNMSTKFTSLFSAPSYVNIDLNLGENAFNNITATENGFVIYNNTTLHYYEFNTFAFSKSFTMIIINILFIDSGSFIVHCFNKTHGTHGIISLSSIQEIKDECPTNTDNQCEEVVALYPYVAYMSKLMIKIFTDYNNVLSQVANIYIPILNSEYFVDFMIMDNLYLLALTNTGYLLMYNLDDNEKYNTLTPFISKFMGENPTMILGDNSNYYIYFNNMTLQIYDQNLNYLKRFNIQMAQKLILSNGIIYAMVDDLIIAYNFTDILLNSRIKELISPKLIDFDVYEYTVVNLFSKNVTLYKINPNYNSFITTICIMENSELSKSSYYYNSTLFVSQGNEIVNSTVQLLLMINGQTVYVNNKSVNSIQHSQMKLSCGNSLTIPLEEIFLGQDLNVSLVQEDGIVQIGQRLVPSTPKKVGIQFVDILYIQELEIYIGIEYPSTVLILDNNLTVVHNTTITRSQYICRAYSIADIFTEATLFFAIGVGCVFNDWEKDEPVKFSENFIQFFNLDLLGLFYLNSQFVEFIPNKMKSTLHVSGSFLIISTQTVLSAEPNSFYSNTVGIISGKPYKSKVLIDDYTLITSKMVGLSSMYIIDFEVIYFPLLMIDYLYLLNIEGSLIILSYDFTALKHIHMGTTPVGNFPVSLSRCGQNLYISFNSNQVSQYFLKSWQILDYTGSISQFGTNFTTNPGSLHCSDTNFAKYLLMTMVKDNSYTYLQVMDNTANELSSIITQNKFSNSSETVFAYFTSPNSITVISNFSFYRFELQDYVISINPPHTCSSNKNVQINLVATNSFNNTKTTGFSLEIQANYNQGQVTVSSIKLWEIIAIIGASLVVIVIIYYLLRIRHNKKKKKVEVQFDLFNYEFMEANFDFDFRE